MNYNLLDKVKFNVIIITQNGLESKKPNNKVIYNNFSFKIFKNIEEMNEYFGDKIIFVNELNYDLDGNVIIKFVYIEDLK